MNRTSSLLILFSTICFLFNFRRVFFLHFSSCSFKLYLCLVRKLLCESNCCILMLMFHMFHSWFIHAGVHQVCCVLVLCWAHFESNALTYTNNIEGVFSAVAKKYISILKHLLAFRPSANNIMNMLNKVLWHNAVPVSIPMHTFCIAKRTQTRSQKNDDCVQVKKWKFARCLRRELHCPFDCIHDCIVDAAAKSVFWFVFDLVFLNYSLHG